MKRLPTSTSTAVRLLGPGLLLAAAPLLATNYSASWTSAVSGSWGDSTKWSNTPQGAYPSNGANTYDVFIAASGSPYTVSGGATVNNVTLGNSSATFLASSLAVTGSLTVSAGNLSAGGLQAGAINVNGGSVGASGSVSVSGAFAANGGVFGLGGGSLTAASFTLAGGTVNITGGGTVGVTGAMVAPSGAYSQNGGSLQAGSFLVNGASISLTNSALNVTGTQQIYSGSLGLGGAFNAGALAINGGSLSMASGGTITGSTQISGGTVTLSNGTFNTTAPTISGGSFSLNGGTFNITGGLQILGGNLVQNGGIIQTPSILLNGGNITGGSLDPALVTCGNSAGSGLDGVSITGDLLLNQGGARVRFRNGTFFAGAAYLSSNSNILYFEATAGQPVSTLAKTVNMTGYNASLSLDGPSPVLSVTPAGIVRGTGYLSHSLLAPVTGVSTVENQGLFSADLSGQALSLSPHVFNNSGIVRAVSGATLVVSPTTSFNNLAGGILSATGGSTLTLQKNWHNAGALILQDTSTLNLQGTFTTGDLGLSGWARTGGTVNVTGTLSNTGSSLALDAASGSFVIAGGTIGGGSVTNTAAGHLIFNNSNGNGLDGVAVVGTLDLDQNGSRVRLRNDSTVAGQITLNNYNNIMAFESTASDPTVTLATTVNLLGTNSILSLDGPSPVVTVAPGGIIRGFGSVYNGYMAGVSGQTTLNNQGVVSADVSGQSIVVSPHLLNNTGTLEAKNGGVLTINATNFSNAGGTLSLSGASVINLQGVWHNQGGFVNLQGTSTLNLEGNFTTADLGLAGWTHSGGGMARILGTLDNTGATAALTPSTGPIMLVAGTIKGGTVNTTGANLLFNGAFANALDGVAVTGNLLLDQYQGKVRLRNDASFSGAANFTYQYNTLSFEATATDNTATLAGTLNLDGYSSTVSVDGPSPILTIAPSGIIRGSGSLVQAGGGVPLTGVSSVVNQGLISADISGQYLVFFMPNFTNQGILEAKNGAFLSMPTSLANFASGKIRLGGGIFLINSNAAGPDLTVGPSARLEGYGEVRFLNATTDSLSLSGTLDPTPGTGGLVIKGDLIPTATATFAFDLAGAAQGTGYDFVSETGNTALNLAGSTLKVTLGRGYTPTNAQTFTILTSTQAITGSFGNVASGARLVTADGYGSFLVAYSGSSVVLSGFLPTPQAAFLSYMDNAFPGVTDPAIVGDSADPDGDGVPNILEFALKGNPASGSNKGLTSNALQDLNASPGYEFCLTIACRQGASFTAQPDGSQKNVTAVDSLHYTVQGGVVMGIWDASVLHTGPSNTGPSGSNLPDLTGSGWEYHTFYLDPALATGPGRFLRAAVDNGP